MDTIGKYKVIRVIGEGGMGRVYEAMDPVIGRRVAIKTIALDVADEETRSRFFREAQAAGQLSHPNLITIHDIGDADGMPYIVMEYLEGLDLNRTIRRERLSYDAKIEIMIAVCEGLAFAHGQNIVHRDIKPANIFRTTQGRIKILDFGLARGSVSEMTRTGKVVGTPNYMAPEQIRGDDVDHRADIFSTGVVFYELLSGRKAFEGESIATTMYKVLETQPQPVHLLDVQLPVALSEVIDRALAKDRLARFQNSSDMLDAIVQAHGRTTQLERSRLHTVPAALSTGVTAPPTPASVTPATPTAPVPAAAVPAAAAPRTSSATIAGWVVAAVAVAALAGLALWNQRSGEQHAAASSTARADAGSAAPAPAAQPAPAEPVPYPVAAAPVVSGSNAKTDVRPNPPPASAPSAATTGRAKAAPPQAAPPRAAEAPAPLPPPPAPVPVPAAPDVKPAATAPPLVVAPPVAPSPPPPAAAVPPPAPPPPPPARAEENTDAAVQSVLGRYRSAIESRDIGALKRIWPALSGRQEDALRDEFEHARAIDVGLDAVQIRSTNGGATVTCRRNYAVTTGDGQTLKTTTTMVMTLARHDGAWSIENIRHEAVR